MRATNCSERLGEKKALGKSQKWTRVSKGKTGGSGRKDDKNKMDKGGEKSRIGVQIRMNGNQERGIVEQKSR